MKIYKIVISIVLGLCLGCTTACHHEHHHDHENDHHHDHDHHHHDEEDHHHDVPANSVKFTEEQRSIIDFATAEVSKEKFGRVIKTTAQVVSAAGDEQVAASRASGIVRFAGGDIVEGASVKKGQRLFTIESSGMADGNMNVRYQEAAANYQAAKAEYERKAELAKDRIVSQTELDRSRAAYEGAKAAYDNLKGNFSPSGAVVCAPMSGYIKNIGVQNGGYVEAGQAVVTISQNKDLYLRAELSPRYYASLRNIKTANIELPDGGGVYTLEELKGAFVNYGKASDSQNPLIPVTFRIQNCGNIIAGSFVKLYIVSEAKEEVIAVDNGGIVEEMGNNFVFVKIAPELFEKRMVTLGGTDGKRTVVTSGLKEGEIVVTKGAMMVKMAQGASALDPHAGHVH